MSEKPIAEQEIVKICSEVLDGQLSIIEASRKIVFLTFSKGLNENDEDLLSFQGIESETDHLPIGNVRKYWNKTALKEKDKEILEYEKWAKEFGLEACRNLINKYNKNKV